MKQEREEGLCHRQLTVKDRGPQSCRKNVPTSTYLWADFLLATTLDKAACESHHIHRCYQHRRGKETEGGDKQTKGISESSNSGWSKHAIVVLSWGRSISQSAPTPTNISIGSYITGLLKILHLGKYKCEMFKTASPLSPTLQLQIFLSLSRTLNYM